MIHRLSQLMCFCFFFSFMQTILFFFSCSWTDLCNNRWRGLTRRNIIAKYTFLSFSIDMHYCDFIRSSLWCCEVISRPVTAVLSVSFFFFFFFYINITASSFSCTLVFKDPSTYENGPFSFSIFFINSIVIILTHLWRVNVSIFSLDRSIPSRRSDWLVFTIVRRLSCVHSVCQCPFYRTL